MNSNYRNSRETSGQNSRGDNVRNSSRQRKRKNHKKSGFIYLMLILFIVAAIVGVSFTVLFNTESIVVENAAVRYSDEAIIQAAGIQVGDNMPRMNTSKIASDIKKQLPYIDTVSIKRSFDNTVTVSVGYTKATAAIMYGAGYVLINSEGKVLETGVAECADYIAVITGVEIEKAVAGENIVFSESDASAHITGMLSVFEEAGFSNVTAVDVTDTQNVTVEVDYRITVKLGSISGAADKLEFGKKVIDESLTSAGTGRLIIDLTGEKAAYVRNENSIEALKDTMEKVSAAAQEGSSGETGGVSENTVPDAQNGENTSGDETTGKSTENLGPVG